ncbi:HAD family hydrolase [Frankia sp. CNm7]|uniref:HAD family hydrolase n=1 Tax=Frankia nepalensis TaxID=1836974 RepID=A0A937USS5_9ACTN|nr:HAD family hydrolase [Frankia nepalensis]MBL7495957.1 HAD family hydrolase [Frankia nepalensis]MBL7515126.1 HAD family hydrolase [Frankia nepalensis]MBL7518866.1 HAD family hydrolase [Frankia nepalensis]MBL7629206.1 HAD family hydrolase [Frankia nepalensis]
MDSGKLAPGARLTLVFDADDTLWENNVRFERVIADYLEWLAHPTLDRAALYAMLMDIEAANAVVHGYGSKVFLRSLHDLFERLRERPVDARERREIDELAAALADHRVELMPGVAETLRALGERHQLALLTKGAPEEQQGKIDASGLAGYFHLGTHIVWEKDVDAYRGLADQLGLEPATTWMIGNSAKSDILPARGAGWRAVHIPNENGWALEHADLDPADAGVLRLPSFTDLLRHF